MLTLHLVPATPPQGERWACAEIRLLRPYLHTSLASGAAVSTGPVLPSGRLDVVVMQRGGPVWAALADVVELVRAVRRRGAKLVYDLDDDLLAQHPSPAAEAEIAAMRPAVRLLLSEADLVTVSTPVLAARVARLNPKVKVWANAIDEQLVLQARPIPVDAPAVGYFGTHSHLEDLLSVAEEVEETLARQAGRPVVALCGASQDPRLTGLFAAVADIALTGSDANYGRFMGMMQAAGFAKVGLAPLTTCAFNAAKSDIKFLDYALFGIPGIYGRSPSYTSVQPGLTGLIAGPGEWSGALQRLLGDADLRRDIATNARAYLLEERTLQRCAPALMGLVEEALS